METNVTMHPDLRLVLKCLGYAPARAARIIPNDIAAEKNPHLRAAMVRTLAQLDQYLAAVRDLRARRVR